MYSLIGLGVVLLILLLLAIIMHTGCVEDKTGIKKDPLGVNVKSDQVFHH